MANYVKISVIGPRPYSVNNELKPEEVVNRIIKHWEVKLNQVLPDKPDLIIVPEACDRPLNYPLDKRIEYYRTRGDRVLDFFLNLAKERGCYIAFSAVREVGDGTWRNSTRIIDRRGNIAGIYDKNYPTIKEMNNGSVIPSDEAPIIQCDFGRIACAICFDLNFDELRLKYAKEKPDLIIFSSVYHGGLMQNYWAYSCQAHFAGAIAGLPSTVISPVGQVIASSTNYFDFATATVNLDCKIIHLDNNRPRLAAMKAKYGPEVQITDPGYLGTILISSETHEYTIEELIQEFGICVFDDYMAESREQRRNRLQV